MPRSLRAALIFGSVSLNETHSLKNVTFIETAKTALSVLIVYSFFISIVVVGGFGLAVVVVGICVVDGEPVLTFVG